MRYILYARKSSESEDRQVQSIDDQLQTLRTLALQRGLEVVEELTESRSAKGTGQRPVFALLLSRLKEGQADAILCWSVNRLSRNPEDSGMLMGMLQRGELKAIQTIEREYRPEDNVLLLTVESGMANQYILDLKKVVARGTRSKVEKGWSPHRAPEGYVNDRVEKTIVPDGDRFALLRKAWDLMLTGAYTVSQVLEALSSWGFRTKKGKKLGGKEISRTALFDLFHNPFYYGVFQHGGSLYPGAHQAMVNKAEWDRVQRLLGREHTIQPKTKDFAFTGMITCGVCGCLVTAEEKVKRYQTTGHTVTYRYYHCTGSKGCPKGSVQEEYIEGKIAETLQRFQLEPNITEFLRSLIEEWFRERPEADRTEKRQREIALSAAKRRRERLFAMREEEEISKDEFQERKARVDREIVEMETAMREEAGKGERDRQSVENAVDFCENGYELFLNGDVRDKRQVARLLGVRYLLTLGNLEIEPHPLLLIINAFEPLESGSGSTKKTQADGLSPSWLDRSERPIPLPDREWPPFPRWTPYATPSSLCQETNNTLSVFLSSVSKSFSNPIYSTKRVAKV